MHWARSCPHKYDKVVNNSYNNNDVRDVKLLQDEEDYEDIKLTLITQGLYDHSVFVAEMGTSAVIDTACS